MTNLTLPSDPQSQIPRHTVGEWFQMDGVCSRKGVAVTYSSTHFQGFQSHQNQRNCGGFGLFSITPQLTVKLTSLLKDGVSACDDDDSFDWCKHKITVKQQWVVYSRDMILLSHAKCRRYVNVQDRREGGIREDLSSDFLVLSFISSLPTI